VCLHLRHSGSLQPAANVDCLNIIANSRKRMHEYKAGSAGLVSDTGDFTGCKTNAYRLQGRTHTRLSEPGCRLAHAIVANSLSQGREKRSMHKRMMRIRNSG
jgi:hypothetical protein